MLMDTISSLQLTTLTLKRIQRTTHATAMAIHQQTASGDKQHTFKIDGQARSHSMSADPNSITCK